ncbi:hypothetical protein AG1IA_09490 [Rhizoctonia solani AG-1 IA]|uniref:Uncharacterized protein n=1 Tax=Thanatephorus cucumeris (strain AG1-IA) TaxID=983506 RepID=L8WE71_THACA|nr:hypothetical protein AG1IA_09490 [Rhizoctonia solani AG-1 IA]
MASVQAKVITNPRANPTGSADVHPRTSCARAHDGQEHPCWPRGQAEGVKGPIPRLSSIHSCATQGSREGEEGRLKY